MNIISVLKRLYYYVVGPVNDRGIETGQIDLCSYLGAMAHSLAYD